VAGEVLVVTTPERRLMRVVVPHLPVRAPPPGSPPSDLSPPPGSAATALWANPRLVFCGAAALTPALAIGARQLGRAYFSVPYAVVGDGGDAGTVPYGEQADTQVAASAPPPPLSVVTSVARAHCTAVL
jgi:hypothetical protein